jgi:hypothetical protein
MAPPSCRRGRRRLARHATKVTLRESHNRHPAGCPISLGGAPDAPSESPGRHGSKSGSSSAALPKMHMCAHARVTRIRVSLSQQAYASQIQILAHLLKRLGAAAHIQLCRSKISRTFRPCKPDDKPNCNDLPARTGPRLLTASRDRRFPHRRCRLWAGPPSVNRAAR